MTINISSIITKSFTVRLSFLLSKHLVLNRSFVWVILLIVVGQLIFMSLDESKEMWFDPVRDMGISMTYACW